MSAWEMPAEISEIQNSKGRYVFARGGPIRDTFIHVAMRRICMPELH
jgi:hypothetical protein